MSWDRNSNWDVKLLQKMWSKYNGAIDETTILSFMTPTIREHELDNKLRKYLESQKAAAKYNIFKEEKEKEEITQFKLPKENLRYAEAEGILWTWGSNVTIPNPSFFILSSRNFNISSSSLIFHHLLQYFTFLFNVSSFSSIPHLPLPF
jgi:hypothetical protein